MARRAREAFQQRVRGGTASAAASRVKVLRKYRAGELPDVAIPRADLLRPLSALALRDGVVARTLFAELFSQLVNAPHASQPEEYVPHLDLVRG
jgi:DNA-dependent protein kinase catalytic subunit